MIDIFLEQIFSLVIVIVEVRIIGNSRVKNYKDQRYSRSTRTRTCLVFEQGFIALYRDLILVLRLVL